MKVERIPAVLHARAPRAVGERPPAPGETLTLVYDDAAGEDVLATSREGVPLRLVGLGRLAPHLRPGDMLVLRVLATEPLLELELCGKAAPEGTRLPASNAGMNEQAAMRLDQAALRHAVGGSLPGAADLAAAWQAQALAHWQRPESQPGVDSAAAIPRTGGADVLEAAPAASPERAPLVWYGWGGVPLTLRPLEEDAPAVRGRVRRRRRGVRLDFVHPSLGALAVHVLEAEGLIHLAFVVEGPEAARAVHRRIKLIAAALGRAGLRLASCRLLQGPHAGRAGGTNPGAGTGGATWAPPVAAFRAAAEIFLALLPPQAPQAPSPPYR